MRTTFTLLLLFVCCMATAQESSIKKDSIKNFSITPVPIVFFSPETNWSFGAAALMQFKLKNQSPENNSSQIYAGAAYTLNKQILFYAPFQLYWNNDKNYSFGEIGFYKYFFQFYGIGISALEEDEELFDVNFPRIDLNYTIKVQPNLYIGPGLYFENFKVENFESGGIIDSNNIAGKEGGLIIGLQFSTILDQRDNIYFPSKGQKFTTKTSLFSNKFGSSYSFWLSDIDYSKYFSIKNSVLAANFGAVLSNGEVPLHLLPLLGGSKRLRAYLKGRYRDNYFIFSQLEWRSPEIYRLRGVLFSSLGGVNSTLNRFTVENFRITYGGGLRVRLNKESVNLRLDYGFNRESSGFYFTVGEAF